MLLNSTSSQTLSSPLPQNKKEAKIAHMFDRIAFRYDLLNSLLSFRQDKRWRKILISWLSHEKGTGLLDVACGTGDVLLAAYQDAPQFLCYTGVDISQGMLDIAKEKAEQRFQNHVAFAKMSAEQLDFKNQNFAALSIAFGLRNVIDKPKALKEFFRVLKPQGSLFILEFFPVKNGILNACFQLYFHKILPFIGGLLSDKEAYSYLPKSVDGFYSFKELQTLLEELGFVVERKRRFLFGSCGLVQARKI